MQRMTAVVAGAAGGAVAIALMELLSERAAFPLMFVPFATSIVLVMGSPEIEAAQPRPLIGGHVVATVVGLLVVKITGPGVFAAALAVGLAMVAMHPPRPFTRRPESIPSSSCSTTCPGVFFSPRWRSEHACWPPWPSFGTTFSAAAAGPRGGGDPVAANRCWRYSAAGSSAAARNRLSAPSRSSTRPRRWNAASVERWPIETIVVRLSRVLRRR